MNIKFIVEWTVDENQDKNFISREFIEEDHAWSLYAQLQLQKVVKAIRIYKQEYTLLDEYDGR